MLTNEVNVKCDEPGAENICVDFVIERGKERQKNRSITQMVNNFAGSHQCRIPVPFSDTVLFRQIRGLRPLTIIPAF